VEEDSRQLGLGGKLPAKRDEKLDEMVSPQSAKGKSPLRQRATRGGPTRRSSTLVMMWVERCCRVGFGTWVLKSTFSQGFFELRTPGPSGEELEMRISRREFLVHGQILPFRRDRFLVLGPNTFF